MVEWPISTPSFLLGASLLLTINRLSFCWGISGRNFGFVRPEDIQDLYGRVALHRMYLKGMLANFKRPVENFRNFMNLANDYRFFCSENAILIWIMIEVLQILDLRAVYRAFQLFPRSEHLVMYFYRDFRQMFGKIATEEITDSK